MSFENREATDEALNYNFGSVIEILARSATYDEKIKKFQPG
jgi:hypothetical protein